MMNRLIAFAFAATLASPLASPAFAQKPSGPPVEFGQKVWVTTSEGWELKGVISKLTDSAIEVSGEAGTKRIAFSDISRIQKRD